MNNVNCALCGAEEWDVHYESTLLSENGLNPEFFRCTSSSYGHHPQIVKCRHCGHIYTNPRWSDEDLNAAYSNVEDVVYAAEREGRELTFQEHLRDMEQTFGPPGGRSLLDVGAYIGVFVEAAVAAGWNASGVEPSLWAVELANQRKIPVNQGTLDDVLNRGQTVDVITLWDVIEHLPEPKREISKTIKLLNPGGYLVIHTMDIDSRIARLMGRKWPWLMDMHLHYFSQDSMANMLDEVGYEVIKIGTQGRYLRLGYLASRVGGINHTLGKISSVTTSKLGLAETAVPVNLGDLFTVFARRPGSSSE
jgi:2-polyprenyl-3-methyl-5-hydroxy-6-metoxy-1,4-benzoquinol methylase